MCIYTYWSNQDRERERERESGRDSLFFCLGVLVWVVYVVLLSCGFQGWVQGLGVFWGGN